LASSSISCFWSFLSEPLVDSVLSWKSLIDVIDGTRLGAPLRARGVGSLLNATWNAFAFGSPFMALPTQPSVSESAVLAACQMSIERKCDWLGFG